MADWRFEARTSYPRDLEEAFTKLEVALLEKLNYSVDYFARYVDARYTGQGWELTIPVGKPATLEEVRERFESKHYATFGFKLNREIEVVVARVFAVRRNPYKYRPIRLEHRSTEPKPVATRLVFFDDWTETPIYSRESLEPGFTVEGPVVVEEYSSSTVVPPGWRLRVGDYGEFWLEVD